MSKNETNAKHAAGSIAKRIAMGLALATSLLLAAPQAASAQEAVAAPPPPAPAEYQYHSNGQRAAGLALMGVGGASLLGAGVTTAVAMSSCADRGTGCGGAGFVILLVSLPLLGGGLLLGGIGIPLYQNGSKVERVGMNSAPPVALSVGVGPQSASLKLTF